eukprot:COSAG02_NODE_23644_length_712_cov_0.959217_2_plen_110_part_01
MGLAEPIHGVMEAPKTKCVAASVHARLVQQLETDGALQVTFKCRAFSPCRLAGHTLFFLLQSSCPCHLVSHLHMSKKAQKNSVCAFSSPRGLRDTEVAGADTPEQTRAAS